jgi:hypothetical protein
MDALEFLALVNNPTTLAPAGAAIHEAYLKKAIADGFTYAPVRDNDAKQKPNILQFALLSVPVKASNVGPFVSVFGYVMEQVVEKGIESLSDLRDFVQGLITRKAGWPAMLIEDEALGERTWKVWAGYAREAEPNHPNLVETYDELDRGTKEYDLYLNAVAAEKLTEWIDDQIAREAIDAEFASN